MSEEVINQTLPIDRLKPHADNYKIHTARQIDDLRASLRKFGQPRSIVVQAPPEPDGDYLIVAGHGVTMAAEAQGWDSLRCDILPASWPPEKVKAYLLADNRLGELALNREDLIAKIVAEVQTFDADLVGATGYNERETNALLAAISSKRPEADAPAANGFQLPTSFVAPTPNRVAAEDNDYAPADESPYAPPVKPEAQFDATKLPDAGGQGEVKKTYLIYVTFPEEEAFYRALYLLTQGHRNERRTGTTMASVAGMEHAGFWEEALGPLVDGDEEGDI